VATLNIKNAFYIMLCSQAHGIFLKILIGNVRNEPFKQPCILCYAKHRISNKH